MYDLARDPYEMKNLAHPQHRTAESDAERVRLHRRLSEIMKENGTTPDEIRWPEVGEFGAEPVPAADVREEAVRP